jgi:DNA-binding winged helix-turn-helix (wHTH) protein
MHILILAPTSSAAQEMQAALGDVAEQYTLAAAWPDVLAALQAAAPDLILIERSALTQLERTTLLSLLEPGRWPPVVLVDTLAAATREGLMLTRRLVQASLPFYQVGDLQIDTRKKRVRFGERWVTLPPLQYRLLLTLAGRAGEVISYRELLRAVWGYDGDDNEARELLKVHVRQIRWRLGLDAQEHPYIRAVRGFGYMLSPPEEE